LNLLALALLAAPIAAQLPADTVITPPGAGVASRIARWSGVWSGWACRSWLCDVKIAVTQVSSEGATLVYAAGAEGLGTKVYRATGLFEDSELIATLETGARMVMRLRDDGSMEMGVWRPETRLLAAGILTQGSALTYSREVVRVPTPWVEAEVPQTLEMVVYRPDGQGPFPTLEFNHSSTGSGSSQKNICPNLDPSRVGEVLHRRRLAGHVSAAARAWKVRWRLR
jgi:hypothetical protein